MQDIPLEVLAVADRLEVVEVGVAQQMFRTLAENGINILVISTSEIKVSVLIEEKFTEQALRSLHTAYDLDAA